MSNSSRSISIISGGGSMKDEPPQAQAGPMIDDEVWQEEFSDSSSEESLSELQLEMERDHLYIRLDLIHERLQANIPMYPPCPSQRPPWGEKTALDDIKGFVVYAMKKLFLAGIAEGMNEVQNGLVLQAMSLCQENSIARFEIFNAAA